jgi:hypothetical protein
MLPITISVRVQQPHTAQKLTILIQNYFKLLQNLLYLQKLYYAQIANLSSRGRLYKKVIKVNYS